MMNGYLAVVIKPLTTKPALVIQMDIACFNMRVKMLC